MLLEKGNMWSILDLTDYFIFTGNSYIRTDGALVMGRGMAQKVRDKWPGIDKTIGHEITHLSRYLIVIENYFPMTTKIGAFQVKYHFKDKAELNLIHQSTTLLAHLANDVPDKRFDMNFPGIGNGRLDYTDVITIIRELPDNVHIWTFGDNHETS